MDVPETTTYFIAGYAVIFIGMAIYLISLAIRFRNLRQDEKMLDEVEKKDEPAPVHLGNNGASEKAGMVMENTAKKE